MNFNIAPHPEGVLFGPVKDWGQDSTKLLLESDGEGDLKVRHQLTLENVMNWLAIPKFQELGGEVALVTVVSTSARQCKEFMGEGSFELAVTSIERNERADDQMIETLDEVLESIVIRPLQLSREPVEDMSYQLKLSFLTGD